MVKQLLFAFCIMIFSSLVVAGPVDSFGLGYSDVSVSSAGALTDAGKPAVAKSNPEISYKTLPAGVGLTEVNTQLLDTHSQTWLSVPRERHRNLLQYEVGWRSYA